MSILASTFRWLQRKRYQYEVTFSLYMLTPTEKFIFNTFIFLFFSMIVVACSLYLPQHIAFITNRAWFYYFGEEAPSAGNPAVTAVSNTAASTGVEIGRRIKDAVVESARASRAASSQGLKVEL